MPFATLTATFKSNEVLQTQGATGAGLLRQMGHETSESLQPPGPGEETFSPLCLGSKKKPPICGFVYRSKLRPVEFFMRTPSD